MYLIQEAHGYWNWVYFVVLILVSHVLAMCSTIFTFYAYFYFIFREFFFNHNSFLFSRHKIVLDIVCATTRK